MAKILLLGSSGFIGRPLLQKLLEEKFQVKYLIHDTEIDLKGDFFRGDILNHTLLDDIIMDDDIVINLIGQVDEPPELINDNVLGSINILNSCIKKKRIHIIFASSISVYGENLENASKENDLPKPQTTYGLIKLITEKIYEHYSRIFGLDITILRFSTLYGPYKKSGFIIKLINSLKTNKINVVFNNGQQIRDLLFVNDAVLGIIQAIKKPQKGFTVFNISSGIQYEINQIINIIEKISNKKLPIQLNSMIPDERCLFANNSKARNLLDFKPKIDVETGLKITLDLS